MFSKKRSKLSFTDFFVFIVCATFIAIFLQLKFQGFTYGEHLINAGGSLGELLGSIGYKYLGRWGVYLVVVVGAILTFVLASQLSLVEAFHTSSNLLGRVFTYIYQKLKLSFSSVYERISERIADYREAKEEDEEEYEEDGEEDEEPSVKIKISKKKKKGVEAKPRRKLEEVLSSKDNEPLISERKDQKVSKKYNQMELQVSSGYQLPSLAFLDCDESDQVSLDPESLKMSARLLESKLKDFSIDGHVSEIHPGPVVTMYEFVPAPGVKLSRIHNLTDDLSLAMGGRPVRVEAPLPNKAAIGIEIPNHQRETVWLKEIIGDEKFQKNESKMMMALGKDIAGIPYMAELQKMPHLLVAGSTGSGKSVSINTMITSLLYKARPDEVRMIMIDPKMIELSIYEGIPHLLLPVVTDPNKANLALKWAVREMERRYKLLSDITARNIENYNKKVESGNFKQKEPDPRSEEEPVVHEGKLPYIVIVVDEFADLMMVASKEIEESICRLAQKARAAGIHVILATQRPSVDVITGIIKANFPSRISFRVTSRHDSRTILDGIGAENLLGMGDMLFVPPGASKKVRLHGAYVSEEEITRIVDFLKKQAKPDYHEEILTPPPESSAGVGGSEDFDEYYDQAVRAVCENKRVSISSIQRMYRIGYNRAARIVEQMESQGVVTKPNGQGQREVLVDAI